MLHAKVITNLLHLAVVWCMYLLHCSCKCKCQFVFQGTAPFIAIELLISQGTIYHKAQHDLKSLFYVLIYICTNIQSPGCLWELGKLEQFESVPMSSWFDAKSSLM